MSVMRVGINVHGGFLQTKYATFSFALHSTNYTCMHDMHEQKLRSCVFSGSLATS